MLSEFGIISEEEIIHTFGERLKNARLKKGMTQESLGNSLGIDKSRISDYENGNRRCSITTAYRLAKTIGVSFDYLFDGKEENEMKKYPKCSDQEKLIRVLTSLGYAIVDWKFVPYVDDSFADFSLMHSLGLTEEALGRAFRRFESIRDAKKPNNSSDCEKLIISTAEDCANELLTSESYISLLKNEAERNLK